MMKEIICSKGKNGFDCHLFADIAEGNSILVIDNRCKEFSDWQFDNAVIILLNSSCYLIDVDEEFLEEWVSVALETYEGEDKELIKKMFEDFMC